MILFALYKYVVAKSGKKLRKKEMMYGRRNGVLEEYCLNFCAIFRLECVSKLITCEQKRKKMQKPKGFLPLAAMLLETHSSRNLLNRDANSSFMKEIIHFQKQKKWIFERQTLEHKGVAKP